MSSKLSTHILKLTGDMDRLYSANPPVIAFFGEWGAAADATGTPTRIGIRVNPQDARAQYERGLHPLSAAEEFISWHINGYQLDVDITHWTGHNEPGWNNAQEMQWYADFEISRMVLMEAHGLKCAIGGFATGTPPLPLWEEFLPAIQHAKDNGHILHLHEYGGTYMWWMAGPNQMDEGEFCGTPEYWHGWSTLRYRQVYDIYLKPNDLVIPLVITELGLDNVRPVPDGWPTGAWKDLGEFWARDKGRSDTAQFYIEQLAWYDQKLRADDYVLGACIFTWGSNGLPWSQFDIADSEAEDVFLQYLEDNYDIDPEPLPEPPPPEPLPEPEPGEQQFRNPSFEDGWYHPGGVPELQIPNEWEFQFDTGPTGNGTEPWDFYVRPEVRVLPAEQLPEHERDLFILDGNYTLKPFKQNGAWRGRFRQVLDLEPGEYTITIPVYSDTYFWNNGKEWATDPLSARIRININQEEGEYQPMVNGQWADYKTTFVTDGIATVTVEFDMGHACDNSGLFTDMWRLQMVAPAPPEKTFEEALWEESVDTQKLSLNPEASIQAEIFADSMNPVTSEASTTYGSTVWVHQAAESLDNGSRIVYYVEHGSYNDVYRIGEDDQSPREEHIWDAATQKQIEDGVSLNQDAAIQKVIFADGFTIVGSEGRLEYDGVNYAYQAGEHLDRRERRVYWCVVGDWSNVSWIGDPYVGNPPPPPPNTGVYLEVEPLSQRDSRWANHVLGQDTGHDETIGSWGCLMVAYNMMARYLGLTSLYPGGYNDYLADEGPSPLSSSCLGHCQLPMKVWSMMAISGAESSHMYAQIREYLDNGIPVPARVDFRPDTGRWEQHWVLLTGYTNDDDFIMCDPWWGDTIPVSERYNISGDDILISVFYTPGDAPEPPPQQDYQYNGRDVTYTPGIHGQVAIGAGMTLTLGDDGLSGHACQVHE